MQFSYSYLKEYLWYLIACARDQRRKSIIYRNVEGPLHIFFCFVDHFEPGQHNDRVTDWLERYRKQVVGHVDADGRKPQHTWCYPCEQLVPDHLNQLSRAAFDGYGEIELHLHHENDTSETLRATLQKAINDYSKVGAFISPWSKRPQFGFVHGNWSLDNSRNVEGRNFCGVNDELTILRDLGCYADFTFPSHEIQSEPGKINSIYYAIDNPSKPKSYDWGSDACTWEQQSGDLLMVEGPLALDWGRRKFGILPYVEDSDLASYNPPATRRIRNWLDAGIHVMGRPNWVFIKVHSHSAHPQHAAYVLGPEMTSVYEALETIYNDGVNYVLHYVTARETYNIIKAAEAGETGKPDSYLDYCIPKPLNRHFYCDQLFDTKFTLDGMTISVKKNAQAKVQFDGAEKNLVINNNQSLKIICNETVSYELK